MSELGDRLRELPLPPAAEARAAAAREAALLVECVAPVPRANRPAARPGLVVALVLLAALVGFAFTPPGRVVTGEIGELVGIGEPATLPPRGGDNLPDDGQPVVIATGHAPDGTVYEVVARRSVATHPNLDSARGDPAPPLMTQPEPVTCLTVDLPQTPALGTVEACVGARATDFLSGNVLDGVNFADRAIPHAESELTGSEARYIVTALLSPNIEEVEMTYEDQSGQRVSGYTDVGRVDKEIAATIDTDDRVGYLVAFLPDDGAPSAQSSGNGPGQRRDAGVLGTVELVGIDGSGQVVARDHFGQRIAHVYSDREQDRIQREFLRAEIEAAERPDGLALTEKHVNLCMQALRAAAATDSCRELIHKAAKRELFGLSTGRGGGEDAVLPD
jgi:hypothetical protein